MLIFDLSAKFLLQSSFSMSCVGLKLCTLINIMVLISFEMFSGYMWFINNDFESSSAFAIENAAHTYRYCVKPLVKWLITNKTIIIIYNLCMYVATRNELIQGFNWMRMINKSFCFIIIMLVFFLFCFSTMERNV